MFQFQFPDNLFWLITLPLLVSLFFYAWYRRRWVMNRMGSTDTIKRLIPNYSSSKEYLKMALILLATAALIIGWANPQWGTKKEKVQQKGTDVFIALDVSISMLAEDIAPSRLERSKRFAQSLIDRMSGNRVALILFAGSAYLQMPLSTDLAAARLLLQTASPDLIPDQGTAIGQALDLAMNAGKTEEQYNKALIVISDGENHDEPAKEQAEKAATSGLLLFTVGVGTEKGALIPINVNGRKDYKRDKSGNPVQSKLNETMLQELAALANGNYFNLASGNEMISNALKTEVDKLEKREFEQRSFTSFESYFQYFIGFALFLLMLDFFISKNKMKLKI